MSGIHRREAVDLLLEMVVGIMTRISFGWLFFCNLMPREAP